MGGITTPRMNKDDMRRILKNEGVTIVLTRGFRLIILKAHALLLFRV